MALLFVLGIIITHGLRTTQESVKTFRDLPPHRKQNVISVVAGVVACWGAVLVIALNLLFG